MHIRSHLKCARARKTRCPVTDGEVAAGGSKVRKRALAAHNDAHDAMQQLMFNLKLSFALLPDFDVVDVPVCLVMRVHARARVWVCVLGSVRDVNDCNLTEPAPPPPKNYWRSTRLRTDRSIRKSVAVQMPAQPAQARE